MRTNNHINDLHLTIIPSRALYVAHNLGQIAVIGSACSVEVYQVRAG